MTDPDLDVLVIPGVPVAKGRPKVVRRGSHAMAYTPQKTVNYETLVKQCAYNWALRCGALHPLEGPVSLVVRAFWPCRAPRKRAPRTAERKAKRPDCDNVLKSVMDGLEGVVYMHDAQVCRATVEKWYAAQGDAPRVEVEVGRVEV